MNPERTILTDTASSLTPKEARERGMYSTPFHVILSSAEYLDTDLEPRLIYEEINRGGTVGTSSPNFEEIKNQLETINNDGYQEVFSLHTGIQSGIRNHAQAAIDQLKDERPDFKVHLINTRTISLAQLFIVDETKDLIDQGIDSQEIIRRAQNLKEDTEFQFFPGSDGIKYLAKGGRVSFIKAFMATTLHITPTLTINKDGEPILAEKYAGSQRLVLKKIVEHLEKDIQERKRPLARLGVAYTQNQELGQELKTRVQHLIEADTVFYEPKEACSVLSAHVGPGAGVIVAMYR